MGLNNTSDVEGICILPFSQVSIWDGWLSISSSRRFVHVCILPPRELKRGNGSVRIGKQKGIEGGGELLVLVCFNVHMWQLRFSSYTQISGSKSFYHTDNIVPYSVKSRVHNLWVCALIRLGIHSQTTGSGYFPQVSWYPCGGAVILPVLDWKSNPSHRQVSPRICLSVDSNGRANLDTQVSQFQIPQAKPRTHNQIRQ